MMMHLNCVRSILKIQDAPEDLEDPDAQRFNYMLILAYRLLAGEKLLYTLFLRSKRVELLRAKLTGGDFSPVVESASAVRLWSASLEDVLPVKQLQHPTTLIEALHRIQPLAILGSEDFDDDSEEVLRTVWFHFMGEAIAIPDPSLSISEHRQLFVNQLDAVLPTPMLEHLRQQLSTGGTMSHLQSVIALNTCHIYYVCRYHEWRGYKSCPSANRVHRPNLGAKTRKTLSLWMEPPMACFWWKHCCWSCDCGWHLLFAAKGVQKVNVTFFCTKLFIPREIRLRLGARITNSLHNIATRQWQTHKMTTLPARWQIIAGGIRLARPTLYVDTLSYYITRSLVVRGRTHPLQTIFCFIGQSQTSHLFLPQAPLLSLNPTKGITFKLWELTVAASQKLMLLEQRANSLGTLSNQDMDLDIEFQRAIRASQETAGASSLMEDMLACAAFRASSPHIITIDDDVDLNKAVERSLADRPKEPQDAWRQTATASMLKQRSSPKDFKYDDDDDEDIIIDLSSPQQSRYSGSYAQ
jgi:hypothetical protein